MSGLTHLAVWIAAALVHIGGGIALAAYLSVGAAIVASSLAGYIWGLLAYFLLQRFAVPIDRPELVHSAPLLLPLTSFAFFVSSMTALLLFTAWYWAIVPPLIWLALGLLTAEISIQRWIRRMRQAGREYDRDLAIHLVNEAQGRWDVLGRCHGRRSILRRRYGYPFP
jgi:hypothetical protein